MRLCLTLPFLLGGTALAQPADFESFDAGLLSSETSASFSLGLAAPLDTLAALPKPELRGLPPERLDAARLGAVTGVLAATSAALYAYQKHAWWAAEHRTSFHLHFGDSSEHMDKAGHFVGTAAQAHVIARAFEWSGMTPNRSALAGSVAAWLLQLNVEVNDGFNALWGFDPYDVAANTLGAGFFYARERIPALEPFALKFSYWPTPGVTDHPPDFEGRPPSPIDDYEGHTYWLSLRVHDVLPAAAKPYWPAWLGVAGGVSGYKLETDEAARAYFLSLDVDLTRVLPAHTWLGAQLRELANHLHLPAPALRLSPRLTPYLLYYSQE